MWIEDGEQLIQVGYCVAQYVDISLVAVTLSQGPPVVLDPIV